MYLVEGFAELGIISSASTSVVRVPLSADASFLSSLSPSSNLPPSPISIPFRRARHPNVLVLAHHTMPDLVLISTILMPTAIAFRPHLEMSRSCMTRPWADQQHKEV